VALIVIVGGIFLIRKLGNKKEVAGPLPEEDVAIIEVEPTEPVIAPEPLPRPKVEPVVEPAPEVEPARTIIEPGDIGGEAATIIAEAQQAIGAGHTIAARDKLNRVLVSMSLSAEERGAVKAMLAMLSKKWLFSRDPYATDTLTGTYKVQPGDLLEKIAKKHKVPYEILMTINNIKRPQQLRAGDTIKIINGPFHAIIYRSTFAMDLYLGNKTYVKSYKVGLGEEGLETPTGKWRVAKGGKLIKPTWTDPGTGRTYVADDPDYPLGSRYIGLEGIEGNAKGRTGFAIHGTKEPETIRTRSSRGCVRLLNGEVIEVYNLLTSGLSEVRVVD
jgi:lipoprotein-anchoring transpeptidase ErfK/SrfK